MCSVKFVKNELAEKDFRAPGNWITKVVKLNLTYKRENGETNTKNTKTLNVCEKKNKSWMSAAKEDWHLEKERRKKTSTRAERDALIECKWSSQMKSGGIKGETRRASNFTLGYNMTRGQNESKKKPDESMAKILTLNKITKDLKIVKLWIQASNAHAGCSEAFHKTCLL